jgi:hypothetical protein
MINRLFNDLLSPVEMIYLNTIIDDLKFSNRLTVTLLHQELLEIFSVDMVIIIIERLQLHEII